MSHALSPAAPPPTLEERLKRALVPPALELWRITRREKLKGEPGLKLLPFLIDPERAALDIGANRGIWAGEMARLTDMVWAFEPNPKLFAFLVSALGGQVICRGEALSDTDGQAALMVPGSAGRYSNQQASLSAQRVADAAHMKVGVSTARLDSLDPPPVGFMKIDVEGHERAVLEGARATIARDRPAMIIEIEERHSGRPLDAELDYVEALGYRTHPIIRGHLARRADLDVARHHRSRVGRRDYVNNFVFLPE